MAGLADNAVVQALLAHELPAPTSAQKQAAVEWEPRAEKLLEKNLKAIEPQLVELDAHLTLRSYVSGFTLSKADLLVWGALRQNHVASGVIKTGARINVSRWYKFIEDSNPWVAAAVTDAASAARKAAASTATTSAAEDLYDIGLQDTSKGVVTRFPPEPSGYLHVGHAKAALLNDYFAHEKYKGTLILRFDDTNPAKEKQEFQDSIVEDLALMGVHADKTTHTSDYFSELYDFCVKLIKQGDAYADDTLQEQMREQRMEGLPSARRDSSVEESLQRFEEMKAGTAEGLRWCIRAKISVDAPNKALRDPVIYRCSPDQPHHRTGSTWKIYPTYDFCCPIVDSIEGVTHALRTTEYNDRDAQYQWFLQALKLRHVYNWNFSRFNLIRTLLSKRKLTKIVDEGVVWGWDDPRMPTVRGVRRRGMTVPGLREFILSQGPSKNTVNLDWTSFWAINKKHIDPIAARYTALSSQNIVTCTVAGARASPYAEDKELHAKYALGSKKVWYSPRILLEQDDAAALEQGEEITLMNWGNAIVRSISHSLNPLHLSLVTAVELELHLQGDVKKTKKKLTWLSKDQELVPVEIVDFDYLITKDKLEDDDKLEDVLTKVTEFRVPALADCNTAALQKDQVMQFDRKGYFRVDTPFLHGQPAVFFQIPTGKAVAPK